MFMVYNPPEFHVSRDSDALIITIKGKPIENCHTMTALLFAFHENNTLNSCILSKAPLLKIIQDHYVSSTGKTLVHKFARVPCSCY